MTMSPCTSCGEAHDNRGPRCEECAPTATVLRQSSPRERGYDAAWDRLSKRARALQPWCSDCEGEDRLTVDHLPIAWVRKEQGLAVRIEDVEVVCNDCNIKRGSSRVGSDRGVGGQQ